jgi:hypothetical protein
MEDRGFSALLGEEGLLGLHVEEDGFVEARDELGFVANLQLYRGVDL